MGWDVNFFEMDQIFVIEEEEQGLRIFDQMKAMQSFAKFCRKMSVVTKIGKSCPSAQHSAQPSASAMTGRTQHISC